MAIDSSSRASIRHTIKGKRQFDDSKTNNSFVSSLQPNLDFKSIIILAEGWPSWVYAIAGLFGDTSCFVSSKTSDSKM